MEDVYAEVWDLYQEIDSVISENGDLSQFDERVQALPPQQLVQLWSVSVSGRRAGTKLFHKRWGALVLASFPSPENNKEIEKFPLEYKPGESILDMQYAGTQKICGGGDNDLFIVVGTDSSTSYRYKCTPHPANRESFKVGDVVHTWLNHAETLLVGSTDKMEDAMAWIIGEAWKGT